MSIENASDEARNDEHDDVEPDERIELDGLLEEIAPSETSEEREDPEAETDPASVDDADDAPLPPAPRVEFDAQLPLAERVTALVRRWLSRSEAFPVDPAAERLAGILKDPNGLEFTVGFVDGVARPEDLAVAAENLSRLTGRTPRFLPPYVRAAIATGGAVGPLLPWVVVPAARRVLRQMVGHLVVDATPSKLGPAIAKLREGGNRLNLNLLGEAVLGDREAGRRLEGTRRLLARDDVDYVSIKVSSIVSQLSMWSFDDAVDRVVSTLTPLYELAAASPTPKFINLDMEEYRDLDLTIAVFTRILDQPQLADLEAGIVLQAYLPDALGALQELTRWATVRRDAGGAAIKVRVVKGANLAMEHVDAAIHGWPLATYSSKQETDTNYKRVLDFAFSEENARAVRIGVAGHNLFDIAYAWILANERGVEDRIDFEMLLGMATGQAEAIKEDVGRLLLYTPVVSPSEFDVAISYLIRRLEENSSQENFMSAVFELTRDERLFERERQRFLVSLRALDDEVPAPNRAQDRVREWAASSGARLVQAHAGAGEHPVDPGADGLTQAVLGLSRGSSVGSDLGGGFRNEADTDPALPANRAWAKRILDRVSESTLGSDTIAAAAITTEEELDRVVDAVVKRAARWGERLGYDRAAILDRAGLTLAANRDRLIEVMASETGKTIAEADPEVSEAIDFAHYYATRARELDAISGAAFVPSRLTVVTPPWNFPVAIPAGSVLSALAAGSGVIVKPAPQAKRSAAVMVEALWDAGIPKDLLALVDVEEGELGKRLISGPKVDRVILTGAYETAKLFRSWRPELPLLAETSGKNAIIVTPSADLDLAVSDVVKSAFGHAGQKCSAASLVILVGSVNRSKRFRRQLVDAASSLRVGWPEDARSQMGPLIEPASGKLEHALTTLGADESWLIEPRQLDETGRLWSPGIRDNVQAESYFHLTEFFGPVLGIMHAHTLEEAIALQNASDYGLTAGLHSLDAGELEVWLDSVDAGNLYVNRGITGAIVRRQPFGGWKRSAVGAGSKAGGPNYLVGLGSWRPVAAKPSTTLHLRGLDERARHFIEAAQSSLTFEQFDLLRRSALSDQLAWGTEFGVVKDLSGVGVERNLFRYLRVPVAIRLVDGGDLGELLRIIAAGLLTRSRIEISTPVDLPAGVRHILGGDQLATIAGLVPTVTIETDVQWLARLASGEIAAKRIRIVGDHAAEPAGSATAESFPVRSAGSAGDRPDPVRRGAPMAHEGAGSRTFGSLARHDIGEDRAEETLIVASGAEDVPDVAVSAGAVDPGGVLDDAAEAEEVTENPTRSFSDVLTGIERGSRPKPVPLVADDGTRIPLATAAARAVSGSPDVAIYAQPVTSAGRIELLPFLREQAISITAHRFGNPSTLSDGII